MEEFCVLSPVLPVDEDDDHTLVLRFLLSWLVPCRIVKLKTE